MSPSPTPILLLSNGHGEDLSGARVGTELRRRGLAVEALPLVGHGHAYRQAGIPILGTTREFSTGGLGYTTMAGRLTELRQGQPLYLFRRFLTFLRHRGRFALLVGIGDVVPVVALWLSGRPAAVYLVAYSSHYEGKLRLPWPCATLLRSRRMTMVWSRDRLTADDLSGQLGRRVAFLGNPFLDPVTVGRTDPTAPTRPAGPGQTLALLPGSRMPEALGNLDLMLGVLERLPSGLAAPARLRIQAALVRDLDAAAIAQLGERRGWRFESGEGEPGDGASLLRGPLRLDLHWGRFAAVLTASDLVLAMTGTATEQAVGLGKPVVQLAGHGPQFTAHFAEAQRRLLGPGVHCAAGPVGAASTLEATARLIQDDLQHLKDPSAGSRWRQQLATIARERIGHPGGSARMADAIMRHCSSMARA